MDRRPYAAIAAAVVSVSAAAILIRWSDSPPLVIAAYRLTLATLILAPFALRERPRSFLELPRADLAKLAGVGLLLASHFALWITSIKMVAAGVTVASSVVLVTSHPLLVGLISHFGFRERVSPAMAAGIGVGFAGIVVIAAGDVGAGTATFLGDFLSFLAGIAAGLYFLAGRRLRQRVPILSYALPAYATAAAALWFLVFATAASPVPSGSVPRELVLFLAMAVVPQIGGHTLYNWSLRYVPAPIVSLSLVGEPIGASLLAWWLLSESPSAVVAFGGALILAGIGLTVWGSEAARAGREPGSRRVEP